MICCAICESFIQEGHVSGHCKLNDVRIEDSTNTNQSCALGRKIKSNISETTRDVNIHKIQPSKNIMRSIDQQTITDLVLSIKENGLLQPIMIRPILNGYEIVFGRHRLEACKRLGWMKIPSVIRDLSSDESGILQITENLQRNVKMNPVKEGKFYSMLFRNGMSMRGIGRRLGKSGVYIQDRISIADKLVPSVKSLVSHNLINPSMAHRIAEVSSELQYKTARRAIDEKWRIKDFELNIRNRQVVECRCLHCPTHGALLNYSRKPRPPLKELYFSGTWIKIRTNRLEEICVFCEHLLRVGEYRFPLKYKGNLTSYESCLDCAMLRTPESFQQLFNILKQKSHRQLTVKQISII